VLGYDCVYGVGVWCYVQACDNRISEHMNNKRWFVVIAIYVCGCTAIALTHSEVISVH